MSKLTDTAISSLVANLERFILIHKIQASSTHTHIYIHPHTTNACSYQSLILVYIYIYIYIYRFEIWPYLMKLVLCMWLVLHVLQWGSLHVCEFWEAVRTQLLPNIYIYILSLDDARTAVQVYIIDACHWQSYQLMIMFFADWERSKQALKLIYLANQRIKHQTNLPEQAISIKTVHSPTLWKDQ